MKRDDALRSLARHYPDGIVVPVFQAAFDWMVIRPHPLNYVSIGAMGQASSHGLGLSLGCPNEPILVLDGDGSLLMNLGTLVTIASQKPKNLWHVLCNNGLYEVNGEYPIPGNGIVDFAGLARAAGFPRVYEFSDLSVFEDELPEVLSGEGPVFVNLIIEKGETYPRDYVAIHSEHARNNFREAIHKRLSQAAD